MQVLGAQIVAALWAIGLPATKAYARRDRQSLTLQDLPHPIQSILRLTPKIQIDSEGYAVIENPHDQSSNRVPVAQTQWNIERSNRFERLFGDEPLGIVLHWFGASFSGKDTIACYLRGFDGLRTVEGYETRTSAHFVIGGGLTAQVRDGAEMEVGILQTQIPDDDGLPFVASHLSALNLEAHQRREQYFVRAWYQLYQKYPGIHSILTDFYDGPARDPNYRTIAIELAGSNFDEPGNLPSEQQMANAVSMVCAVMKRYQISILNVFGHYEIELRKSDPGKIFLNFIRYLIGIQALVTDDQELQHLVFGSFHQEEADPDQAIRNYFEFLRDYFILVSFPDQVYRWEALANYWIIWKNLASLARKKPLTTQQNFFDLMKMPLKEDISLKGNYFIHPENHAGIDLYLQENQNPSGNSQPVGVYLPALGECIYVGYEPSHRGYKTAFRHYQPDGAAVITVYENLSKLAELKIGEIYPQGCKIGEFIRWSISGEGYLKFIIAYGATWDTLFKNSMALPSNVNKDWILRRFTDPMEYIQRWENLPLTT
jgi:hypothetical protein